jgi:hypothetical protein
MFQDFVNLGGQSPMGRRARLRNPILNPVRKVTGGMGGARLASTQFALGAGGGGGGGGFWHGGGGGYYPYYSISYPYYYPTYGYYPYLYPYAYSPYYYGYGYNYPYSYGYTYPAQTYTQTVPSSCCYDVDTGSLYCPGSEYDGAPALAGDAAVPGPTDVLRDLASPWSSAVVLELPIRGRPSLVANRSRLRRR